MSIDIESSFPEYDSTVLDALLIDPVVRAVIEEAMKANRVNGGMDRNEAQAKCHAFDAQWANLGLMSQEGTITGLGRYVMPATDTEGAEIIIRRSDDVKILSNGFTLLPVDQDGSGDFMEDRWRLALVFEEKLDGDTDASHGKCPIAFSLDEIESLEFGNSMSLEQADAVLNYYAPDLKRRLDVAIHSSEDETAALFSLSEIIYDGSQLFDDIKKVFRAVNVYIECNLAFEQLPYVVNVLRTEAVSVNADTLDKIELEFDRETLITVNKLVMLAPVADEDTDTIGIIHIDCSSHDEAKFSPGCRLLFPAYRITHMTSLREQFYGAMKGYDV